MKKTLLGVTLVAATVLVGVSNVDAAKDRLNGETEVGIGFSKDTVTKGPYKDNLTLVRYPSAFDFGSSNKLSVAAAAETFPEVKVAGEEQYLGVFDDRHEATTLDKGWKLNAKLDDLKNVEDDTKTLVGNMEMSFTSATKWNATETKDKTDWILPNPRTADATTAFTPEQKAGYELAKVTAEAGKEVSAPVKLVIGGDAVDIMGAKDQKAAARGGVVTSPRETKLNIASGAVNEASYTGKLHWTLSTAYTGN